MFFVTVASGSLGLLFLRHRRTGAFQYITVNDAISVSTNLALQIANIAYSFSLLQ